MNDTLGKLINTVFDKLESLDEREFKKNLSKYYDHPLTELLSRSNKFKDNSYEFPYIPFLPEYTTAYQSTILATQCTVKWDYIIQANVSLGSAPLLARDWLSYSTAANIENSIQIIGGSDSAIFGIVDIDEGYSWAQAA